MSESLREQLLQAGFKQNKSAPPKKKQRPPKASAAHSNRQKKPPVAKTAQSAKSLAQQKLANDAAKRKAIKAEIKTLIEASAIKDITGEVVYRFTLQNRIREIHVTDTIRQQLVASTLLVTRLNGSTYVVPDSTAQEIRQLNPQWALVSPNDKTTDTGEGYDDFPVPDDITW